MAQRWRDGGGAGAAHGLGWRERRREGGERMAARKEARRASLARTTSASCFASERRWRRAIHHPAIETAGGRHSHAALDFTVSATVCMGEYFLVSLLIFIGCSQQVFLHTQTKDLNNVGTFFGPVDPPSALYMSSLHFTALFILLSLSVLLHRDFVGKCATESGCFQTTTMKVEVSSYC